MNNELYLVQGLKNLRLSMCDIQWAKAHGFVYESYETVEGQDEPMRVLHVNYWGYQHPVPYRQEMWLKSFSNGYIPAVEICNRNRNESHYASQVDDNGPGGLRYHQDVPVVATIRAFSSTTGSIVKLENVEVLVTHFPPVENSRVTHLVRVPKGCGLARCFPATYLACEGGILVQQASLSAPSYS